MKFITAPCTMLCLFITMISVHNASAANSQGSTIKLFSWELNQELLETSAIAAAAVFVFLFLFSFICFIKLVITSRRVTSIKKEAEIATKIAKEENRTDHLTGMNNHRGFYEKSHQVLTEAKRIAEPLSILLVDIDHFKNMNDTYGHIVGDELIKSVAGIIEDAKREMDISARIAWEEFIILAPFTEIPGAVTLADRIRERIEKTLHTSKKEVIPMTVSVGVYGVKEHSEMCTIEEYIRNADEALRQAKDEGRNRVVIYGGNA